MHGEDGELDRADIETVAGTANCDSGSGDRENIELVEEKERLGVPICTEANAERGAEVATLADCSKCASAATNEYASDDLAPASPKLTVMSCSASPSNSSSSANELTLLAISMSEEVKDDEGALCDPRILLSDWYHV